jgi:hypothetical protein
MATAHGDKLTSLRLLASPVLPMVFGFRAPFSAQLLVPIAVTFLIYVALIALFAYGAVKTHRENVSILYFVAIVFPFIYVLSSKAVYGAPRFALVLTPLLALLAAQLARSFPRAVALLAIVGAVSAITLYRMEEWFTATPPKTSYAHGVGPRHVSQWVPWNLGPLVSTLDRLHLDHVYTDYWIAYRLDFDTRERIVAASNYLRGVTFDHGQAIANAPPADRWPPYTLAVKRARHGFVFYRPIVNTSPIIPQLRSHGYRAYTVDTFVVYAPRA